MQKIPGITREEEEQNLKETIEVAEQKVTGVRQNVAQLKKELHAMQEEFDTADKEMQALWHNTDDMFRHVSQELARAIQARKKPYFGRIDFTDKKSGKKESYYIGRSVIAKNPAEPMVIDWRAPIAGIYYGSSLGDMTYSVKGEGRYEVHLSRKRTYEIEDDRLKVQLLGRGFAWLDTGTVESLMDAAVFVQTVQNRQDVIISAPEEVAYHMGWLTKAQLLAAAAQYQNAPYGAHLRAVAEDKLVFERELHD